ncbi:MAG: XRE family transcriptional regulator [Bacteriovoracaceae bacterium]
MKKNKVTVSKNAKELAAALGLSPLDAIEWEVRLMITNKIISSAEGSHLTVTDIANLAGTSRARITKILKNDTHGISLDVLVRVLGALGEKMKISFKKAA